MTQFHHLPGIETLVLAFSKLLWRSFRRSEWRVHWYDRTYCTNFPTESDCIRRTNNDYGDKWRCTHMTLSCDDIQLCARLTISSREQSVSAEMCDPFLLGELWSKQVFKPDILGHELLPFFFFRFMSHRILCAMIHISPKMSFGAVRPLLRVAIRVVISRYQAQRTQPEDSRVIVDHLRTGLCAHDDIAKNDVFLFRFATRFSSRQIHN